MCARCRPHISSHSRNPEFLSKRSLLAGSSSVDLSRRICFEEDIDIDPGAFFSSPSPSAATQPANPIATNIYSYVSCPSPSSHIQSKGVANVDFGTSLNCPVPPAHGQTLLGSTGPIVTRRLDSDQLIKGSGFISVRLFPAVTVHTLSQESVSGVSVRSFPAVTVHTLSQESAFIALEHQKGGLKPVQVIAGRSSAAAASSLTRSSSSNASNYASSLTRRSSSNAGSYASSLTRRSSSNAGSYASSLTRRSSSNAGSYASSLTRSSSSNASSFLSGLSPEYLLLNNRALKKTAITRFLPSSQNVI
ncbi:hypothetical protein CEUSTIGMA_g18.t1 [Chlamydomonas eustigma]|uniref:Uncharacterized protein n=1 Tax=Chlamydomonas eustigma TaxID=1157962 RepID=A0A250WPI0_9CHLO|nr:hypothetical protein CEUSTIGMA_g18.t1 [Chlamydomonas eustigma]|eukprot:GAX72562.1 hypothetical protein CEUSTIGMA_g18.t1 [Chlamydomonas eustigma]